MNLFRQLATVAALLAVFGARDIGAQEPVGKRLSAIVGVAVEEYAKGVDSSGRLVSSVELDEATGFLKEARDVAVRLKTPNAAAVRVVIDSLAVAASRRVSPAVLSGFYRTFSDLLGVEGALDMPTRSIDLVQGRSLYERMCASCHGTSGSGSAAPVGAPAGTPPPPAIGQRSIMHEVTPALTYRIVSVGIQGTAMVGWSAQLTPDERWDVVSYVNSLRATDAARARGASLLKKLCADCGNDVPARTFAWQTERSDAQLAGMIRAGDPATGMLASVPVTEVDADALVAALRGMAVVMPASAAAQADGSSDPRTAARTVLRMLDDAVLAARTGRQTDAADLAFDAYIAFEPLETNVRMRDPGLVARLERQFAEFHGALKAGDLAAADANRLDIEQAMPTVLELAAPSSTPWGSFLESFLIILREGFEAILVIGAIVAFLIKTGHKKRVRDVWIGSAAGLGASLVLALLLRTVLSAVPASREIVEGVTLLVAVVVLFSVSYWLLSKVESARWQQFIRDKVTVALSNGGSFTLAFVAFLAVFREGAETALFFQALITKSSGTLMPVVAGVGAGGATLAVVFSLFYRFGVKIPLRPFFAVTSGLLYWMALVFAGKGIKELQEGGAMTRTFLPGFPHVEVLGLYPTVETLIAQLVLIGLLLFALWRTLRPSAEAAEAAMTPVDAEPMSPEVASRLAELQVSAKQLQDRVTSLEKEVEYDTSILGHRKPS